MHGETRWPDHSLAIQAGIGHQFICSRSLTAYEKRCDEAAWRYCCYRYKDLNSLIMDELKCGVITDEVVRIYSAVQSFSHHFEGFRSLDDIVETFYAEYDRYLVNLFRPYAEPFLDDEIFCVKFD